VRRLRLVICVVVVWHLALNVLRGKFLLPSIQVDVGLLTFRCRYGSVQSPFKPTT
jgi:hypothetical protein